MHSVLIYGRATDSTTRLQKAVNQALIWNFGGPGESFSLSDVVQLRSGMKLFGHGATLTMTAEDTEIFNVEGLSDIEITGFVFVGHGDDYSDSDSSRACAIFGGTSGTNITVHNNKFTNFCYTAARFKAQSNVNFTKNRVYMPGSGVITAVTSGKLYGVLADAGCAGVWIKDNHFYQGAQGVRVEQTSDCTIDNNRMYDIYGQHGVYAGSGLTNLTVTDNKIYSPALCGIKVQAADAAAVDNRNIVVTGNTVLDAGDQGILLCNSASSSTYVNRGITVNGNTVRNSTGQNIYVSQSVNGTVVGNSCDTAGQSGVAWSECDNITFADNGVNGSAASGMRDISPSSTRITLRANKITDCATADAGAGDDNGIRLEFGSHYTLDGNEMRDADANMQYGIYIAAAMNDTLTLTDNKVFNATDASVRFSDTTTPLLENRRNSWHGGTVASYGDPPPPSITAAATITLLQGHDVFIITGNTGITSITAPGFSGRTVRLVFTGTPTVTDGSNLKLAGNFVATADDVLTLTCDGTNWYEVARSTN